MDWGPIPSFLNGRSFGNDGNGIGIGSHCPKDCLIKIIPKAIPSCGGPGYLRAAAPPTRMDLLRFLGLGQFSKCVQVEAINLTEMRPRTVPPGQRPRPNGPGASPVQ